MVDSKPVDHFLTHLGNVSFYKISVYEHVIPFVTDTNL